MLAFEQPLLLLLLVPIGALVYLAWRRTSLPFPRRQRLLILVCRLALFTLIITALAGATWEQPVSRQTVIFVADISASTSTQRAFIEQWIGNALRYKRANDQVGIVAVGRNALIEQAITSKIDFTHFESTPDTNYTDLAAGLRLAAAILPSDSLRRIVLLSDGQQNLGDALLETQLLRQEGIRLDIVPLPTINTAEARIDALDAPTALHTNEHFVLHIQLSSTVTQDVTLRLYLDHTLLLQQAVHIVAGSQEVSFTLLAPTPGFHTFHVSMDAPQDTLAQNNQASAFVNVQGPPRVLIIEGRPNAGQNVLAALRATKIDAVLGTANDVPTTLDGLAPYSSVVLADVPAVSLGTTRMQILQSFVRDLGHGLVVSGGENSYGVGGYANTPLEQTLPLRMDIPQHKDTPDIAVVLIIESLEENGAINISKEAAKGVVSLLTPHDQVAISAAYGTLAIPMQHVTNKTAINNAIDALNPNDPASYLPDLQNAEQVLLHTDAKIKHVILLGDGDTLDGLPAQSQATKMANEHITISTVATNAANNAELSTMQQIATFGKGRFYRADNPAAVPQVLLQETQQAARRAIVNEPFIPAIVAAHPILTGLGALPRLDGYVATTPKPSAQMVLVSHRDDPVLAVWQYGLGRVAAWTSDALGLWTANWLSWSESARWWANLVTWTLPAPDSALNINGKIVGGVGQLTVDLPPAASAGASRQSGQQQVQVRIVTPELSQETVTLQPTAPGRWQGNFPALQVGAYLLQVTWRASANGGNGAVSQLTAATGLVVPYSPEFRNLGTDMHFLELLAQTGNGSLLATNNYAAAFAQNLLPVSAATSIAFLLLALAALLLPIDIATRRLSSLEFLVVGYRWLVTRFGPHAKYSTTSPMQGKETIVSIPLNSLRATRAQQRDQATRVSSLSTRQEASTAKVASPPAIPTQESASTVGKLLEAKRKATQKRD